MWGRYRVVRGWYTGGTRLRWRTVRGCGAGWYGQSRSTPPRLATSTQYCPIGPSGSAEIHRGAFYGRGGFFFVFWQPQFGHSSSPIEDEAVKACPSAPEQRNPCHEMQHGDGGAGGSERGGNGAEVSGRDDSSDVMSRRRHCTWASASSLLRIAMSTHTFNSSPPSERRKA